MTSLVFDIETDDLNATKIWCLSTCDVDTEHVCSYWGDKLDKGLEALQNADKLIGHNIIGFDIPVLKKLTGVDLSGKKLIDTLVLSRLFNPVREGNHGLESWGFRLDCPKIEFNDYQTFSIDMVKYCERDVLLNKRVYDALSKEKHGFSRDCIDLEQSIAGILNKQREKGFLLDVKFATLLLATLKDKLDATVAEVHKEFKPEEHTLILYPVKTKAGKLSRMAVASDGSKYRLNSDEYDALEAHDQVARISRTEFNLGSRKQIGEYLQKFGWKPSKFTPTGQPIVDESTLKRIDAIPQAKLIADYLMYQKRIAQIKSWLDSADDDGRVHGFVNPNGTITGRMTHREPNLAQVPSSSSPYGKDCRACWIVPKGYNLVGIDASGLELRMLAHYMNDKEFTDEILHGDIHSSNQKIAGLKSRNQAKTFIYAFIYGAGNEKIGSVVGGSKQDGQRLKQRFLDNLPSLRTLKNRVTRAAAKGFIKGLDGRKIYIRSAHSALNALLQGGGSIVMKKALELLNQYIIEQKLNAHFVANIHDEWQIEVAEKDADRVGKLGVKAIQQAGLAFDMKCPLDGEYHIGDNWSETH
tara:strand:+ start:982 stop:2730 length:1749 start_codon:yes stop_codon:yes gene_type:complete